MLEKVQQGLILTCTLQGEIDVVLADDCGVDAARHVGESFVHLVDTASITKALRMLAELQAGRSVTAWEMNVAVGAQLRTLQFAGFRRDDSLYIVGAEHDGEMMRLYDDLTRMNNEQITMIRRTIKERIQAAPTFQPTDAYYDEVMKINNELVTLQRKLSQNNRDLERLNSQKNQLLGMVAHDLRNPLAVIQEYSDFLLESIGERLTPDEREYLTEIHNSSHFMLAMVSDLLDLSAVEAGRLTLNRRPVDLGMLASRVITLSKPQADRKRIMLELEFEHSLPHVLGDEVKLQQVLNNLVSNAIKYSSPGTMTRLRLSRQGDMAVVEIQDHGQGIPAEEVSKLFKPYSRTSVRTTGGESSTGLGLAICRRIVEGHGGAIRVESTVGVGTAFTFTLPLVTGNDASTAAQPASTAAQPASTAAQPASTAAQPDSTAAQPANTAAQPVPSGVRVLLVEDSPVNRQVLMQTLRKLGCVVDSAENGVDAIAAATRQTYDLIFLDFHLPDMTAPEIAQQLRRLSDESRRIFALTGGVSPDERAACIEAGIEDVLLKPLARSRLQQILATAPPSPAVE